MAADLHIHVLWHSTVTEYELENTWLPIFFSNTMGSKHFVWGPDNRWLQAARTIGDTPSVHVGEVSWLKAGLSDDAATFVPAPVQSVHTIVGEDLPVIDDELLAKIADGLQYPNATSYYMSDPGSIMAFLNEHKGKRVFTVSW